MVIFFFFFLVSMHYCPAMDLTAPSFHIALVFPLKSSCLYWMDRLCSNPPQVYGEFIRVNLSVTILSSLWHPKIARHRA